jgi:hypothetical protein
MRIDIPNEDPFAKPYSDWVNRKLHKCEDGDKDGDKDNVPDCLLIAYTQGLSEFRYLERLSYQVLYSLYTVERLYTITITCSAIPLAFSYEMLFTLASRPYDLINRNPLKMTKGRMATRKRLSSQQWAKAKIMPKLLVKAALINSPTFSPMAFSIVLIFLATLAASFPASIESYHATYCWSKVS